MANVQNLSWHKRYVERRQKSRQVKSRLKDLFTSTGPIKETYEKSEILENARV